MGLQSFSWHQCCLYRYTGSSVRVREASWGILTGVAGSLFLVGGLPACKSGANLCCLSSSVFGGAVGLTTPAAVAYVHLVVYCT